MTVSIDRRTLRCFVVDDEPLARQHLARLINEDERLEWTGEAANGRDALSLLATSNVDVVFLDISMPGPNGIEVAEKLPDDIRLVFTTAYEEYAVTAFELQALDYLLKPFGRSRFLRTVDRLVDTEHVQAAMRVEAAFDQAAELEFVTVRSRGRMQVVAVHDIRWMEAADDYVAIHHGDERHLVNVTMSEFEARLPVKAFVRVHRSHIIRLADIERVDLIGGGRAQIHLTGGERIPVSRTGLKRLRNTPGLL